MTHPQLSGYLTRTALVGMAIFCGAARGGESDRTQAAPSALLWQVAEIDLTSSKTYANPYGEIDVTVTFTGPRRRVRHTAGVLGRRQRVESAICAHGGRIVELANGVFGSDQ